ncbi:MAG: YjbQ family protein [Acidobacteria bacterium]|nr:MAG: YjbQ family protein [Acidobacteriota bacterium]
MIAVAERFEIATKGFCDIHDITDRVQSAVARHGLGEGLATVFVPGSTAGITTIEYESGALADLRRAIERIAPQEIHYDHDARWGDGNGFAHVRAALLGPSLPVPVTGGRLALGTWQQIVLVDFDNRPRQRPVVVQLLGAGAS